MIGALPDDWPVVTFRHLCLALGGEETSFTGDLLRLIMKADGGNRARLRVAFPEQVAYWEVWMEHEQGALEAWRLAELAARRAHGSARVT